MSEIYRKLFGCYINSSYEGEYSKKENQTTGKGFLGENCHLKWICLSQVLIEFSEKILK